MAAVWEIDLVSDSEMKAVEVVLLTEAQKARYLGQGEVFGMIAAEVVDMAVSMSAQSLSRKIAEVVRAMVEIAAVLRVLFLSLIAL